MLPVRAALSSVLLVNCRKSVVLYFGPLAPRLAASVVAHWGGNRTVPWPLVEDSLPPLSFALPDQPPPSDLSGLDPGDPLGLMQDVP